jgi:hypothetical protein
MSALSILLYVAVIVYVLARKVQGQAIVEPKKLFVLPVLVTVIGYGDISGRGTNGVDVAVTVIASILSLVFGLQRGRVDKMTVRDGFPFMQWGAASLILFGANLVVKALIDLVGLAAGGTTSAAVHSLVFTLGLTLVGEAVVVWVRSGSVQLPAAPQETAIGLGATPVGVDRRATVGDPVGRKG